MKMRNLLIALLVLAGLGIIAVGIYYTFNLDIAIIIRLVFCLLMLFDTLAYFLVAWGLYKRINWIFGFAYLVLTINILGFFFDDIGLADTIAALFNLMLVVLFITYKRGEIGTRNKLSA